MHEKNGVVAPTTAPGLAFAVLHAAELLGRSLFPGDKVGVGLPMEDRPAGVVAPRVDDRGVGAGVCPQSGWPEVVFAEFGGYEQG